MSSCTGCASKFSLFRGEKSCPKCGFSFCSKCLCEKITVEKTPGSSNKQQIAVCRNCATLNRAQQNQSQSEGKVAKEIPPASQQQQRQSAAATFSRNLPGNFNKPNLVQPESSQNPKIESTKDDEIKQRLESLQKDRKGPVVSQTELEDRIARLKGLDPEKARAAAQIPFRFPVDNRTQSEQSKDLLAQFTEEEALDRKRPTAEEEIAQRLAKLKDQPIPEPKRSDPETDVDPAQFLASASSTKDDDWSEKNLDDVDKLLQQYAVDHTKRAKNDLKTLQNDSEVKKYLKKNDGKKKNDKGAENRDDGHSSSDNSESEEAEHELERIQNEMKLEEQSENAEFAEIVGAKIEPEEELPYCCICNEDAVLRCVDCDGDLYCRRCFKEGHDKEDEHKVVLYKPPQRKLS